MEVCDGGFFNVEQNALVYRRLSFGTGVSNIGQSEFKRDNYAYNWTPYMTARGYSV